MKKFLLSFVLILFACTCVFSACSDKGLNDNPATDAAVIGNGGYAVQKGDYLYYANGFLQNYVSALKEDKSLNKEGQVVFGGIYRTKLVNGKLQKDENGFLTKTEQVVSKLVGFENGGFYILGDYIYFVSPHMNQDGGGTLRTDYTDFYKVKIDGTNLEKLYTSRSASVNDWNVYEIDGITYVVVVELIPSDTTTSTNIVSINAKTSKSKTLATNISTYALSDNNELNSEFEKFVYYTYTNENGVSKVCKSSIVSGEIQEYEIVSGASYSLIDFKNDNLYLTITSNDTLLYRLDLSSNENLRNIEPYALTDSQYSKYYVIDNVLNNIIAVDNENYMYYIVNGIVRELLLSNSVTFVGISDNCVYYIDTTLKRVSFEGEVENLGSTDKSYLLSLASHVDINGGKIFVFASYEAENAGSNYYLNVINVFGNKQDSEFVGLFKDDHKPAEPTAEEKEDGTVWVK